MTPDRSTVVGAALLAVAVSMPLVAQRPSRTLPGFARLWNDVIAFIPAVSSFTGNDLFR